MANIKINNTRKLSLKLRNDQYWDFMLFKDEAYGRGSEFFDDENMGCLASFISSNDDECVKYFDNGKVFSNKSWDGAINEPEDDDEKGLILKNIGFTGVDNGLVFYDKNITSNLQFFNYYTRSHFDTLGETRLNLSVVRSNTGEHWYPVHLVGEEAEKYFEFKGGFLQGFFKTYGHKYQTLPDYIESDWCLNFSLRPRKEYEVDEHTLNYEHPENNGIFFYLGTRAENKFWEQFASEQEKEKLKRYFIEGGYNEVQEDVKDYNGDNLPYEFDEEYHVQADDSCPTTPQDWISPGVITLDEEIQYVSGVILKDCCEMDVPVEPDYYSEIVCGDETNPWIEAGYFIKDISLDDIDIETLGGYSLDKNTSSAYEITSNNKYLLFNQTCSGYTVPKWEKDDGENKTFVFITEKKKIPNYYLLFNQTRTGYTVNTIDDYYEENLDEYDIYRDLYRNAFCLKANEDGSISYRYLLKNCGEGSDYYEYPGEILDEKLKVIEETTSPGLLVDGEWNSVTVRFSILGGTGLDKCSTTIGKRLMQIYIYVGGYLKFISKPLPEIRLRPLNDVADKQEGVPYNISIGGGTQGLADTVSLDFMSHTDYTLPLEKVFGGSFMGDVRLFRFYDCALDLTAIRSFKK